MPERPQRDRADRALRDLREYRVAELRERDRRDPQQAVRDDHSERQSHGQMLRIREEIHHPLEQDRHIDRCELRGRQQRERADDSEAYRRIARRP